MRYLLFLNKIAVVAYVTVWAQHNYNFPLLQNSAPLHDIITKPIFMKF